MSFHFNLSSDEEAEQSNGWSQRDVGVDDLRSKLPADVWTAAATVVHSNVARAPSPSGSLEESGFSCCESDDEIDWVDAGEDETIFDTEGQAASTLKPVTIDLGNKRDKKDTPSQAKRESKRKAKLVYRFGSLPQELQFLLSNLHQTHLLVSTSRAVHLSQFCSGFELLHVIQSLVPQRFLDIGANISQSTPSLTELREFMAWYFDLVNRTSARRRQTRTAHTAAGARAPKRRKGPHKRKAGSDSIQASYDSTVPSLLDACSFLSSANDDDPLLLQQHTTITDHQKTLLLVSVTRSLGWKARYVCALEPCSVDLDVNHPLLRNGMISLFQSLRSERKHTGDEEPKILRKSQVDEINMRDASAHSSHNATELGWVEVLCTVPTKTAGQAKQGEGNPSGRWVHVDPAREAIDQPNIVERELYAVHHDRSYSNKRRATIQFALAVEHRPMLLTDESVLSTWVHSSSDDTTSWNAWNHTRLTDVTQRYASSWSQTLKLRGLSSRSRSTDQNWWPDTLRQCNASYKARAVVVTRRYEQSVLLSRGASKVEAIELDGMSCGNRSGASLVTEDDTHSTDEKTELQAAARREAIPTNKSGFKNHPVYAIQSGLNSTEVLAPGAKTRMCGIFKGEIIFRRSDVSKAIPAKKWLYLGRMVKDDEMMKPAKRIKGRKRPATKGFQALRSYGVGDGNDGSEAARDREIERGSKPETDCDGMKDLYAFWQTEPWSPEHVGPNDPIPVNEYNNVELELLNPGLSHLVEPRIGTVAKKLGIPYAPCLLGFEGHGGNRTPTIRGIVVHDHNVDVLREANAEVLDQVMEQEHEDRQQAVYKRWKRLMVGVLTKDRIEREYGDR